MTLEEFNKYPYKHMKKFLDIISNDDSLKLYELSIKGGACLHDTTEVVKMMAYLTSFGRVTTNENGNFYLVKEKSNKIKPDFRTHFLKEMMVLLKELEKGPINLNAFNNNQTEIIHRLSFLKDLTAKGSIVLEENNWPKVVKLVKWSNDDKNV